MGIVYMLCIYIDKIGSFYFHWIIVLFVVASTNVLLLKCGQEREQFIDKSLVLILWITVPLILLKKDKNILAQKEKHKLIILLEYDDAIILTKQK